MLYVPPPLGGNEGVSREAQWTFLIAMLKQTDRYRKEHLPPEPESGLSGGKSLEQVTGKRFVVVEKTVQKCDRQSRRIGARHVRLSFS
jgi:hypothetical protein